MNVDTAGDRAAQVVARLARPGEADCVRSGAGIERQRHLLCGGNVEAVDPVGQVVDHGGHRIRLDGVVKAHAGGQQAAQFLHTGVDR